MKLHENIIEEITSHNIYSHSCSTRLFIQIHNLFVSSLFTLFFHFLFLWHILKNIFRIMNWIKLIRGYMGRDEGIFLPNPSWWVKKNSTQADSSHKSDPTRHGSDWTHGFDNFIIIIIIIIIIINKLSKKNININILKKLKD